MELQEISENVNKDKLKQWLRTAGMPLLREPTFFEEMGFDRCFVRRFLKKHQNLLKHGGTVQKNVRGVNESDFLIGLAEEIGIDTSKVAIRHSGSIRMTEIAKLCMKVIAEAGSENNGNEYRKDDYARENAGTKLSPIPAPAGLSTFNYMDSEVNSMSNVQIPNSDNYKLENKLRRIALLPIIMLIVVAGMVAGILGLVILVKFLGFGLETFDLKFW